MPHSLHHGSCHCGAVCFEADIDLAEGTSKCNCTWCFKHRYWSLSVPPERFRVLSGEDLLKSEGSLPGICPRCGTITFATVPVTEWNPQVRINISVAAFDDIAPADLAEAPVTYLDGRHDNWWNPPEETRHL